MATDLVALLDALYREEINVQFGSFFDAGWRVELGDSANGISASSNVDRADQIADELVRLVGIYLPDSDFAKAWLKAEADRQETLRRKLDQLISVYPQEMAVLRRKLEEGIAQGYDTELLKRTVAMVMQVTGASAGSAKLWSDVINYLVSDIKAKAAQAKAPGRPHLNDAEFHSGGLSKGPLESMYVNSLLVGGSKWSTLKALWDQDDIGVEYADGFQPTEFWIAKPDDRGGLAFALVTETFYRQVETLVKAQQSGGAP